MKFWILPALFASALSYASGDFQATCSRISINQKVLHASCKDTHGTSWSSSLELRGLDNMDGSLTISSLGQTSSFQNSCRSVSVSQSGLLTAACQKADGSWIRASFDLNSQISNYNGTLVYEM